MRYMAIAPIASNGRRVISGRDFADAIIRMFGFGRAVTHSCPIPGRSVVLLRERIFPSSPPPRRACYSSLWPPPIWSPRKANNDGATLPLSSRKSGRGRSTLVIPSESVVSANPPILVNSFSPPAPSPGEQRALLVTYFYLPEQKRTAAGVPSIAHLSVSLCLCERIAAEREI